MVFGIGTEWRVATPSGETGTHRAFVAGLAMRPHHVVSDHPTACIEIRLPPWVAGDLFQTVLGETGGVVGMLGRGSDQLVEMVANTNDPGAATLEIVLMMAARLSSGISRTKAEVRWAWRRVIQTNGQVSVRDLAREIGWSDRHLTACFRKQIGLSPKAAARLARFSWAHRHVTGTDRPLALVAIDAGYSDQSHMNREFKELAGAAPKVIRRAAGCDVAIRDEPPTL